MQQEVSNLTSLETTVKGREIQAGIDYLVSNYNPHVGLISEAPHSDVYWLDSDNFLAALALNSSNWSSNSTITAIADNISRTLARYAPSLGNATNQYMLLSSYWKGSCSLYSANNYTITYIGNAKIMVTLNNGSGSLSETQYADVAFLQAICNLHQGNITGWSQGFSDGVRFFNGVGVVNDTVVGFNDTAFQEGSSKGIYQTYKLALDVYATESQCEPFNQATYQLALTTLLQMQAPDGGFYTGYNPDLSINGTTNVETTSLALLAMSTVTFCLR
ncbi:MAG: hypothetical protein ACLQEQ_03150 [Nitrososphaerales archaeon]